VIVVDTRATAAAHARRYAPLLALLLAPTPADLSPGFSCSRSGSVWRRVLAATAVAHEAKAFVTADQAFSSTFRVPFVGLGSAEFDALLSD
jgi:hypothetical protein